MKAVLISIQPKWCGLIATGKKTIEVRKNRPKIDTPFKGYIYCTKNKDESDLLELYRWSDGKIKKMNSRVIGEFVCDMIFPIPVGYSDPKSDTTLNAFLNTWLSNTCLTEEEITNYIGNGKTGYGWHISDLKIYDEPKYLNDFMRNRSPQSWCYVKALMS